MIDQRVPGWVAESVRGIDVPGSLDEFAASLSQRHRTALRVRRDAKIDQWPIRLRSIPWYTLGYQATEDQPRPSQLWGFASGDFYLQDAGSLLALSAAEADSDLWRRAFVCDLCASPGGKASALLEAVTETTDGEPAGFLLANEVIRSRLGVLQWNLARTGSDRYAISNHDPETLAEILPGVFDVVLVDAPCSGQALLGRGKQKLAALSHKQIEHSAARQQRILDAAVRLLRPGGSLLYSTCTFSVAENEAQIRRLIESAPFRPAECSRLERFQSDEGCYRLWPHRDACAGSFAARLALDDQVESSEQGVAGIMTGRRGGLDSRLVEEVGTYFNVDDSMRLHELDSTIIGWPADAPWWVDQVAVMGPELLHRTGQTWKPSHAAAVRCVMRGRFETSFDLDEPQAQAYMRGEPVSSPVKGWHLVRYLGRPLGWVKGNGTLAKNHLPAAARVQGSRLLGPTD
jgi:16S rRNA C967 or C1407 C5-methylase (RsmB/RsmF family)/NOL1/NOP2/fmu family ribosome biogenesis protein